MASIMMGTIFVGGAARGGPGRPRNRNAGKIYINVSWRVTEWNKQDVGFHGTASPRHRLSLQIRASNYSLSKLMNVA